MNSKTAISIMLLSAVCVTPAFANYFSNPNLNVHFNVGSAPNPTVRDVRENHVPQMTRVTKPNVDVVTTPAPKNATTPVASEQARPVQPVARTADAADSVPTLRLRYL